MAEPGEITPTAGGTDFEERKLHIDGQVRLERFRGSLQILVDLFASDIQDPSRAHIASEVFPATPSGASQATRWLHEEGVSLTVLPPAAPQ